MNSDVQVVRCRTGKHIVWFTRPDVSRNWVRVRIGGAGLDASFVFWTFASPQLRLTMDQFHRLGLKKFGARALPLWLALLPPFTRTTITAILGR